MEEKHRLQAQRILNENQMSQCMKLARGAGGPVLHHGDAAESLVAKQNKWRGSWPTDLSGFYLIQTMPCSKSNSCCWSYSKVFGMKCHFMTLDTNKQIQAQLLFCLATATAATFASKETQKSHQLKTNDHKTNGCKCFQSTPDLGKIWHLTTCLSHAWAPCAFSNPSAVLSSFVTREAIQTLSTGWCNC